MNRIIIATGLAILVGCQQAQPIGTTQNVPPSIRVVPLSYYHIRYSPKLKKNIKEIIPVEELEPHEATIINGDKKENILLDRAIEDVYKAQTNVVNRAK